MVSTSLIGTDTQVRVRPFWPRDPLPSDFLAQLNGWADLTELVLPPGGEALKIARHVYEERVFTWIGLYRHADAFESSRKHNFIGAGFFLREPDIADATAAITYLFDALQAFMQKYVRDSRQTAALFEIDQASIAIPESAAALDKSIQPRSGPGGLTPAERSRLGTGLVFIDSKDVKADLAARYVEWAQSGWQFAKYHTLIIGTKPTKMLMTKHKAFTPRELERLKPPAPPRPPSKRAAPGQPQKHRTDSSDRGSGPRFSSRPQSLALDDISLVKDRHDQGVVKGIIGTLCGVLIVWGLYIAQLWVTRSPIPDQTITAVPVTTTSAAIGPIASAGSDDLGAAYKTTEQFFRTLCGRGSSSDFWALGIQPLEIDAFKQRYVPLCPLTVELGTASGPDSVDGIVRTQIEIRAKGGKALSWASGGRVVLQNQPDPEGRPGAWKIVSISFDTATPTL